MFYLPFLRFFYLTHYSVQYSSLARVDVNMAGRMITRTRPNILVTGTPGTGKTITCSEVADKTGYKHVDVGQVAKANSYYEGWDEQYQCPILDEDKVVITV